MFDILILIIVQYFQVLYQTCRFLSNANHENTSSPTNKLRSL